MTPHTPPNSAGAVLASVIAHLTTLVRKEILLARVEIGEQIDRAARAIAILTLAAILLICGLVVLAGAAVAALTAAGLSAGWAAALVAGVVLTVAVALILRGRAMLRTVTLVPSQTVTALSDDFDTLKESFHDT